MPSYTIFDGLDVSVFDLKINCIGFIEDSKKIHRLKKTSDNKSRCGCYLDLVYLIKKYETRNKQIFKRLDENFSFCGICWREYEKQRIKKKKEKQE